MTIDPFFDTNILIYAFARGDRRWNEAQVLLASGGSFSVQVANEFVDVGRRKLAWSWAEAALALNWVKSCLGEPLVVTAEMQARGLAISTRFGFRIFDGCVLAAAALTGCCVLLSEDMRHGQIIDGVEIRNPFIDNTP